MPSETSLNPAVLRLAHPLAFSAYLRHIGAPVGGYYRRQGLPALCNDPNAFVPLGKAWGLFDDAACREDEDMGWLVGRFVGDHNLSGVLLKKLESAPTLYQALKKLIAMVTSEASHLQLGILEKRNRILFHTCYPGMKYEPGYLVSQAYQLEVYIDLVRHFAGKRWAPPEIGLEAANFPTVLKEQFPDSRIRINQPFGYISIPRCCLHKKLIANHSESENEKPLVDALALDYSQKLEVLLEPYLPQGYLNMQFAASLMDTSVRTLARRLAGCGKTYQALLDEVRFRKARSLLNDSEWPVGAVARSVGFSDQANFTHMFQRVSGISPRSYRMTCREQSGQAEAPINLEA